MGYRGDSEISDSEDERSPQGEQPPGVGKSMFLSPSTTSLCMLTFQLRLRVKYISFSLGQFKYWPFL